MAKHYMTPHGKKKLEAELKELTTVVRPQVIRSISEARAHGDLSENAEYHAAKEKQGFVEGRIADIKAKLADAEIVDPTKIKSDKVTFGATVTLEDSDTSTTITYQIVGTDEADIKAKKISYESPLAKAIIGKKKGEDAQHHTAKGEKIYTIVEIAYEHEAH